MSLHYVWVGGEVVPVADDGESALLRSDHLCVDTAFPPGSASRYGSYNLKGGWLPVRYADLPAEFKTHLLLLGVS